MKALCSLLIVTLFGSLSQLSFADDKWVTYEGQDGPGKGKRVVLISGDEEYRSEEALPMLGKLLAVRHGFTCTVLFAQDPETGEIDPTNQTNIPGMHQLEDADLVILGLRFRELPDKDMKHFDDYLKAGKPIIALRTSTHAFNYSRDKDSPFAKYSFNAKGEWKGGFGQHVLGETWVNHHGGHGRESTGGVVREENAGHPILKGVKDVWGPTDVYGVVHLPDDATVSDGRTSADRHEAERSSQSRQADDAARLGSRIPITRRKKQNPLHHDGRLSRSRKRGVTPTRCEWSLLGDRPRKQNYERRQCETGRRLQADLLWFQQIYQGCEGFRSQTVRTCLIHTLGRFARTSIVARLSDLRESVFSQHAPVAQLDRATDF